MIKSISYWSMPRGLEGTCPIETALALAKTHAFAGIELAIAETGVLTPATDQAACETYRRAAEKSGLALETLASGMSWGCCPTHPDPAVRNRSIALHAAALQRAAWLGCQAMLLVPGAVTIPWDASFGPVRYDHAVTWAKQAVTQLAPIAERLNIDLCLENVWNGMFYSPLELAAFIDAIASPRVGIYFDATNVLGYHQFPPHWIELLGKRIRRVHIKDFKREVGSLVGFCRLFEGDMPFKETLHALKAIGYDKSIVAEMIPYTDGLLEHTSAAMDRVLAM
jgi:hexulose-6-phosphate isomerase